MERFIKLMKTLDTESLKKIILSDELENMDCFAAVVKELESRISENEFIEFCNNF